MPLDSPLVRRAAALAREAHEGHFRKAPRVPYFEHLEAVATVLAEHGVDDDATLAAAYLHDLLEDQPAFADRMRDAMPAEVVAMVEALTEHKKDASGRVRDKRARFDGYLARLAADDEAAARARPISCADKIHNTRSLVEAEAEGHRLLLKLSTRPGEHERQLARLREVYARTVDEALLATFDQAAAALLETIEAWLPGRAVLIAAEAHLGQYDKAGAPYVYHPLRLMMGAETPSERMAAALHDVVEDSHWTLEELAREGFSPAVLRAVDHLTKRENEGYEDFVERVARDRLATRVKLLDLRDNADLSRIEAPTPKDEARVARYRRAIERLEAELRKRSLFVELDGPSREAVRARALHPVVRGDHVTLVHRVDPANVNADHLVPGAAVGDEVELRAVSEHANDRIQALVVELGGTSTRPSDGGALHVTVSRTEAARSRDSNELIAETDGEPVEGLVLRGTVRWVDR